MFFLLSLAWLEPDLARDKRHLLLSVLPHDERLLLLGEDDGDGIGPRARIHGRVLGEAVLFRDVEVTANRGR